MFQYGLFVNVFVIKLNHKLIVIVLKTVEKLLYHYHAMKPKNCNTIY